MEMVHRSEDGQEPDEIEFGLAWSRLIERHHLGLLRWIEVAADTNPRAVRIFI